MKNDFYVYEYYKKENNEVFYVGKGTHRRMFELHNRSKYFMNVYNKYDCAVHKIYDNLTNEEACQLEIKTIAEKWSIGQAYCNFNTGGEGFSEGKLNPIHERIKRGEVHLFDGTEGYSYTAFLGHHHTEESKALISAHRQGKGARFGKDNPMYGKEGLKGKHNPMYGMTGEKHPNSRMYLVTYKDGSEEKLTSKQCEHKFSIAFTRIRGIGGTLHYKKQTKNDIYEGTILKPV